MKNDTSETKLSDLELSQKQKREIAMIYRIKIGSSKAMCVYIAKFL